MAEITQASILHQVEVRSKYMMEESKSPYWKYKFKPRDEFSPEYVEWLEDQINL